MIIYKKTKKEFLYDVLESDYEIEDIISSAVANKLNRGTGKSEYNSWKNSLSEMAKILYSDKIPLEVTVCIEYNIPRTNKILSSLPISYTWKIVEKSLDKDKAVILGTLSVGTGSIVRSADSMGICEHSELKGNGGLHFMNARAETRALKRAIEVLFGSVINYYVIKYLK